MNLTKEKARKMLKTLYDIACNASMTGNLQDGGEVLAVNYNQIREVAIKNEWVGADWVVEIKIGDDELLNEDSEWMDVIGTAAKLFMIQLEDDEE